ncbi:MAG: 23S rRNA (uracil(1939)-C(5))-methyltransferase RlmD [Saccharofermentanales bacterium]
MGNNRHILDITSLTSEGNGVGRIGNLAVFVEGAIPGDRVETEIIQKNKSYSIGGMLKIIEPSIDRIDSACKVSNRCGGCSFRPMAYRAQCAWKENMVFEAMNRIGGFQRDFLSNITAPAIVMDNPCFYRNNVQMAIAGSPQDPQIGFYEKDSHVVADTAECLIIPPVADAIRKVTREFIINNELTIYKEPSGPGLMRHLVIRSGFHTRQVMVIIVTSKATDAFDDEFIALLKAEVENTGMSLTSVYINVNDKETNLAFGKKFTLIYGKEYIEEKMNGIKYRISPYTFFQINTVQAEAMIVKIIEIAALNPKSIAIDLYCGSGSITLSLASHCKKAIGVEIIEQSIADGKINALLNNIRNVEFHTGNAHEIFPSLVEDGVRADLLVIDPPRKGLDNGLPEYIAKTSIPKIIYVSCNPATLARDCKIICENGRYEIMSIQPVDMFPWTKHVECVALITRVEE